MTYKNILWVEDFDIKDGGAEYRSRNKLLNSQQNRRQQIEQLFTNKYASCVNVKESLNSAIQEIEDNISDYDCVVLDVNLKNDGQNKDDRFIPIDKFRAGCVDLEKMEEKEKKAILDNAGYYIYLYLLHKGFPCNRIVMMTAYAETEEHKEVRRKFEIARILPPDTYSKTTKVNEAGTTFLEKLEELYTNSNHYYKIRQLIFAACSFYENKLEKLDSDNEGFPLISYNKCLSYGDKDRKLSYIDISSILDNVKQQFPQQSSDLNKCYLGTLRILVAPFDRGYDTKNFPKDGWSSVMTIWQVMKLMRNWISHGRLEGTVLTSDFLLLFMTVLRAYFADMGGNEIKTYEYDIFQYVSQLSPEKDNQEAEFVMKQVRENVQNLYVERFNEFSQKRVFTLNYNDILESLGNQKAYTGPYKRFLELICLTPARQGKDQNDIRMDLSSNGQLNIKWEIRDSILERILGINEKDFLAQVRQACHKLNYI